MAISVDSLTRVIYIPQADLTPLGGSLYELDMDTFRLALKDWEDNDQGMAMPNTHNHNTEVLLSGVTYARIVEIINGYTVEFENGSYTVTCTGANHNLGDVKVPNQVSLIINNSAGLTAPITVLDVWQHVVEGTYTAEQLLRILVAVAAGKASGLEGASPAFRNIADTKDRVAGTYSAGTRTITTRDGS